MSYYDPPLKVRYQHVGRHRNMQATYPGRKILAALLLMLSIDIGFFIIFSTVDNATTPLPSGVIVQHQPTSPELIPPTTLGK